MAFVDELGTLFSQLQEAMKEFIEEPCPWPCCPNQMNEDFALQDRIVQFDQVLKLRVQELQLWANASDEDLRSAAESIAQCAKENRGYLYSKPYLTLSHLVQHDYFTCAELALLVTQECREVARQQLAGLSLSPVE